MAVPMKKPRISRWYIGPLVNRWSNRAPPKLSMASHQLWLRFRGDAVVTAPVGCVMLLCDLQSPNPIGEEILPMLMYKREEVGGVKVRLK